MSITETIGATLATGGIGGMTLAQALPIPDDVATWPVHIAMAGVACFGWWLFFQHSRATAKEMSEATKHHYEALAMLSEKIGQNAEAQHQLTEALRRSPCLLHRAAADYDGNLPPDIARAFDVAKREARRTGEAMR